MVPATALLHQPIELQVQGFLDELLDRLREGSFGRVANRFHPKAVVVVSDGRVVNGRDEIHEWIELLTGPAGLASGDELTVELQQLFPVESMGRTLEVSMLLCWQLAERRGHAQLAIHCYPNGWKVMLATVTSLT